MKLKVRGHEIAYDDTGGKGIPLVLVHGFPLDRRIWSAQASALADVARVIAPDLRGFGESANGNGSGTTMDVYAQDVRGLLDALDIRTAVVGGVSMGGYVAMALHRQSADRIRGLVLVDTRSGPDSNEGKHARDTSIALVRAEGAKAISAQMIGKLLTPATASSNVPMRQALSDLMTSQPVGGIVGALAAMRDRPDSKPTIAHVAVPTLVVTGAEDAIIAPKEAEALHAAIRGSRLVSIPGAGHLPNYERPREFNAAVRGFLATLG